jgi:tetratricopeptide (TPR) repeat protein
MTASVPKADLDTWIGSVHTARDRSQFPDIRKRIQDALYQALLVHGVGDIAVNGDVAYNMMLLLAGRGALPKFFGPVSAADPPGFRTANQLYQPLDASRLHSDVALAAKLARSVEVTNEFVFGTIDDALLVVKDGLRLWPDVGELWRQSGVIAIAQGRYADAISDLGRASSIKPDMIHLQQPLTRAHELLADATRGARGEYLDATLAFHRTPLQVLTLDVASFGVYTLYWFIRNRRLAERRLGIKPMPIWQWVVPLWNVIVYYSSAIIIGKRVKAAGIDYRVPFVWQAVALMIISSLWRLPNPWWLLSLASSLALATMHVSLNRAEKLDYPTLASPRLTVWEYIIIVVGLALLALAIIGTLMPDTTPVK